MRDVPDPLDALIGDSEPMARLRARVRRLLEGAGATGRVPPVLLRGETGTGKGLLALALHRAGPRRSGPFVDVNCAAIPATLLEAEMFGHERGAFTGAHQARPGLFQAAHRGTLFLDEIGLLPVALQAKLLKALEERAVRRLGGTGPEPADVWLVAATNADLEAAVRQQRFRADLYHRLAVVRLTLPPLRQREADVVQLAEHFLARACADYGLAPRRLAPDALAALRAHAWPGNVRELANALERAVLLGEEVVVTADLLGLPVPAGAGRPARARGRAPGGAPAGPPVAAGSRRLAVLRAVVGDPGAAGAVETAAGKVEAFDGRVESREDGTLVAVFGLTPTEDPVSAAAYAALAIHRALAADGVRAVAPARIALDTLQAEAGEPSAAVVPAAVRSALEALGRAAEAGDLVVSRAAGAFLRRRFALAPLPGGRSGYRVEGLQAASGPPAPGLTRFVGRERELALLEDRWRAAARGAGQVVGVVGAAGLGKSRLLLELRRRLAGEDTRWIEGRCLPFARAMPYLPLAELLGQLCGVHPLDSPAQVAARAARALGAVQLAAPEAVAALLGVMGVKEGPPPAPAGPASRTRAFDLVGELLVRHAARQPLVGVLEDLHWSDPSTEEWLASLVPRLARARLLLVLTYRPGCRVPGLERSFATQVALAPLSPEDGRAVLHDVLETDALADEVAGPIVGRAEGNPFFLEELARAVREGELAGAPGEVPATVQAVLGARLDALPPADAALLAAAAVMGRDFDADQLAAVAGQPEDGVRQALARLGRLELVQPAPAGRAAEWSFRHSLVQEVAYGRLAPGPRRALHGAVLRVLEDRHRDRLDDHAAELGHHAWQAERWAEAVDHLGRAGARAAERSAYQEAVSCLERAVAALARRPAGPEALERGVDLRLALRSALWALGRMEQGLARLREAEPLAEALGDRRRLARLFADRSSNALVLGETAEALQAGRRALAMAREIGDRRLEVNARQFLGVLFTSLGDFREAVAELEASLAALGEVGPGRFAAFYGVHGRTWLTWALTELGDFEEAARHAGAARALAEAAGDPHNLVAAGWAQGFLARARGELDRAVAVLQAALDRCRLDSIAVWRRPCTAVLGHALALAGRDAEALPLLERAAAHDENNVAAGMWMAHLAEAHVLAGRIPAALAWAGRAVRLTAERGEDGFRAHALRVQAAAEARDGRPDAAGATGRQALALATARGMRPLAARIEADLTARPGGGGAPCSSAGH